MKFILSSPILFFKKALTLFMATVLLVPLIHYKLLLPAMVYVGGLLILHIFFFYMYFSNVAWREIGKNKKGLTLRLVSIAFLIYLLTLLKLEGDTTTVLIRLTGVFIIHLLILLFLMVVKVELRYSTLQNKTESRKELRQSRKR